jgi:photosystem II stability/assembly factor-like uncharacterized protein
VKKMVYILIVAMATSLLSGCFGKGSSADPPSDLTASAGDGKVMLTWTASPGVDYWIFSATDPSITAFNLIGLPNQYIHASATTPFYMCGLFSGTPYYFAANARINGGPGGSSSRTIPATPYNASASAYWHANLTPLSSQNIYGVGYASLTTCSNNAISATGSFAAVGASGTVLISNSYDGQNWDPLTWNIPTWNTPANLPPPFHLYAVTGYTANLNNPTTPGLRWVAVGAGGGSVYSTDGINWYVGVDPAKANPPVPTLRSLTQVAGTFFAVGDSGTILSSIDGSTWTIHNSPSVSASNLNGVTHGGIYVAVGDSGTILVSSDGNIWAVRTPATPITSNLRQVTSFLSIYGTIYVAVGDAGTIVTSKDGGTTWIQQTAPTGLNLVGITVESRAVDTTTAVADPLLGFISTAQFVAVDSTGNAYTSTNGLTWSGPIPTGSTSLNALVSSGFGYVAAGNAGATAYAF